MSGNVIQVKTWEECEKHLLDIEKGITSITRPWFRGHGSAAWRLGSTLERKVSKPMRISDYYKVVSRVKPEIESYTDRQWELPGWRDLQFKEYDDLNLNFPAYEYIAYLRHHGFPSPLIDWSKSPYVAAFFAFINPQSETVALFAYCSSPKDMKFGSSDQPGIIELGPRVRTHPRHFRQQSGYTVCTQWTQEGGWHFASHESVFERGEKDQDVLWKITVPASERRKVLSQLDRFNLNAYSLFASEEGLMETLAIRELG